MQTDEDFNIKFVNIVKKHRCLYDKKVPEYRNKDFQEKSWLEIAQETRESVPHCKERWRNLRACLSRYIKQQSSSDPQHKPYYLSEHMQFLLPFLKSTRQSSSSSIGNGNSINYNNYDLKPEISLDTTKQSDVEDTTDGYPNDKPNYLATPKHRYSETDTASVNCVPDVHVEIDQPDTEPEVVFMTSTDRYTASGAAAGDNRKRIKIDHTQDIENPDMDFFRSILPDVQGMSALQKRKFKIGILELVDDVLIKYPEKKQSNSGTSGGGVGGGGICNLDTGNDAPPNGYLRKS